MLKRLDIYESDSPKLQQATTNLVTSRKIRNTLGWIPIKSIFFLEEPNELTFELFIDSTGNNRHRLYYYSNILLGLLIYSRPLEYVFYMMFIYRTKLFMSIISEYCNDVSNTITNYYY